MKERLGATHIMHKVIFYSIVTILVVLTVVLSVILYKSSGLVASLIFAICMAAVLVLL